MPTRLTGALNSYDLVAKSMPGVILILGVATLIPSGYSIPGFSVGNSLADVAIIILTFLLLGLFIGEGVHTFAEEIENGFEWAGHQFDTVRYNIIIFYRMLVFFIKRWFVPRWFQSYLSPLYRWIAGKMGGFHNWLENCYWRFYDTVRGHRLLFANSIAWNYDPSQGRWSVGQKKELYDYFVACFEKEYGVDLTKKNEDDIRDIYYPLITSQLSTEETSLSNRFQAIYSFCRSMWVVFLILAILYSAILYPRYIGGGRLLYTPIILTKAPPRLYPLTVALPLFTSIVFLLGVGKYKRHYIEYLMADFVTVYRDDLPGLDTDGQTILQRWE